MSANTRECEARPRVVTVRTPSAQHGTPGCPVCLARKLWKRQAPLDRHVVRAFFGQQSLHAHQPEAEGGVPSVVGLLQLQLQLDLHPEVTAAEEEALQFIWERNGKDDRTFVEHARDCTRVDHMCARAWLATQNAAPGITLAMWRQQHPLSS